MNTSPVVKNSFTGNMFNRTKYRAADSNKLPNEFLLTSGEIVNRTPSKRTPKHPCSTDFRVPNRTAGPCSRQIRRPKTRGQYPVAHQTTG